jgi:hypothetical protein
MSEQATPERRRYDPVSTRGQDLLYFPDHVPAIQMALKEEVQEQYSQRFADADEEKIEAMARRGVMRTFIGSVSTLLYCDLAKEVVPHLEAGKPIMTDPPQRARPTYMAYPYFYRGSTGDFMDTMLSWLLGAAARVFREASDTGSRYYPLVQGLVTAIRDYHGYVAVDPEKRFALARGVTAPVGSKELWENYTRHAEIFLPHMVLYDNAFVAQELLLHWGLSYSREEGKFPEREELARTAFAGVELLSRAASLKKAPFLSMVHDKPLAPKFYQYECSYLEGPEQLFPGHEQLFALDEDGQYTFRSGPLSKGPLPMIHDCPGARAYRSAEAEHQDAIEGFFEYGERRWGARLPRNGDGTFAAAWGMLTFGNVVGTDTIYEAWPRRE